MPQLSGAEVARAMFALRPNIPIVVTTGYSETLDENSAFEIGIRRLLIKPVSAKVLKDIVVELLVAKTAKQQNRG